MEPATIIQPNSVRKRKFSSCETTDSPKLDISIPGLNRLFDRSIRKPTKCIWIIIILICATVCVGLTVYQLQIYFRSPVASKIFVERKQKVQFPSFSICSVNYKCYRSALENEIRRKCALDGTQECDVGSASLQELNISLREIWNQCNFDNNVSVRIEGSNVVIKLALDAKDYVITNTHSLMGPCVIITHTEEISYLSLMTQLIVRIHAEKLQNDFVFIPHGVPETDVNEFEIFIHEIEMIKIRYNTQLKIQEQVFKLKNTTNRVCYDIESERERIKEHALQLFYNTSIICRLPFLPENFPECQTWDEVSTSVYLSQLAVLSLLAEGNWAIRRLCNHIVYAISVDFVIPNKFLNDEDGEENNDTVLVMKFSDDTSAVVAEYFSYTFPALVSDLFAYWGFFLCLSAFVFVEIIEFFISKIYKMFTRTN